MADQPNAPNGGENQPIPVIPAIPAIPSVRVDPPIPVDPIAGPSGGSSSGNQTGSSDTPKRNCSGYGPETVDTAASTEVEVEEFAILWKLNNFSTLNGVEDILSPIFQGGPKGKHSWQLKIRPKKTSEEQDYLAVHLVSVTLGNKAQKLNVRFQLSLLDSAGRPFRRGGCATLPSAEFSNVTSSWGYSKFMLSSDLMAQSHRLLVDDALKFHCRLWIDGKITHKYTVRPRITYSAEIRNQRKQQLANDFGKLLKSSLNADVFITTHHNSYKAHKSVLAARSSVFAAMFSANNDMDSIEILDFDDEVVKGMLEYVYTGETPLLKDRAPELLHISDKYGLPELKEECEQVITEQIKKENAAEILVMAKTLNACNLKTHVVDYINRNKEEIKLTNAFQKMSLEHPEVFVDLFMAEL